VEYKYHTKEQIEEAKLMVNYHLYAALKERCPFCGADLEFDETYDHESGDCFEMVWCTGCDRSPYEIRDDE